MHKVLIVADWDMCTACYALQEVCERKHSMNITRARAFDAWPMSPIDAVVIDLRADGVPQTRPQSDAWPGYAAFAHECRTRDVTFCVIAGDARSLALMRKWTGCTALPNVRTCAQAVLWLTLWLNKKDDAAK